MRELADGRVKRSEREWREIVGRFEGSGLSVSAFCRQEKLARGTFTRWRRPGRTEPPAEAGDFVELSRLEAAASAEAAAYGAKETPLAAGELELELALAGEGRLRFRP